MPFEFVSCQKCNSTVTVACCKNLTHLTHLIKLCFCVWCAKCAKYLAFGTFDTSVVDALIHFTMEFSIRKSLVSNQFGAIFLQSM